MKIRLPIIVALFFCIDAAQAQTRRVSLSEAFKLALKNSEQVKIQQANVEQSSEALSQAKGSVLPSLSASGQLLRQDVPDELDIPEIQRSAKLSLNQPLFRGGSEYAAIRATKASLISEQAFLEKEKQLLFERVAKVFYELLTNRQDVFHIGTQLDLTQKRVGELVGREKIGRSRRSEVLAAKSQAASLKAQLENAKAQVRISEDGFEQITGIKDAFIPAAKIAPLPILKPMTNYLSRVDRLYDIQALSKQVEAAEAKVSVARGGHLPNLDLTGNYYLKREGQLEDSKWDVILSASLPLFSGGVTQSQVRQALAEREASALNLSLNKKNDVTEIKNLYTQSTTLSSQLANLQEAVATADKSFEEHKKDYRYGLVNNLELLQALNTTIETKRQYDRTTYLFFYNYLSLRLAAGESIEEILRENL